MSADEPTTPTPDTVYRAGVVDVFRDVARLHEGPPVVRRADGGAAVLTMDAVRAVTKRRDVHSMDPVSVEMISQVMGAGRPLIPLMLDGDEHTKYRRLLDPLFAPAKMRALESDIAELAHALIDDFAASGEVELFGAFCEPLPSQIFLRLLGLPASDLDFLLWFKNGIIRPDDEEHRAAASPKLIEYLYAELDRRAALDHPGDDLIGGFMTAEVDGHGLTREDVIDITFLLIMAGLDTVAASLSCMIDWLARNPEQRQRLIDDPELTPAAVEELMRVMTPVVGGGRHAVGDFVIGGVEIHAGDALGVSWAAANMDPTIFEDPTRVDFDRASNPHIAFASGFHRCLGSHLARVELWTALNVLHDRIPDYRIDPDAIPGYNNTAIRTVDPLPLRFTPR